MAHDHEHGENCNHDHDEDEGYQTIEVETRGPALYITINRPKVLNALNERVLAEIGHALVYHVGEELRVVVIQSAGETSFVAGADISPMADMSPEQALAFARQGQSVSQTLERLPQVTIARVQGFALGGGCELAMACDLVVAADTASFGQPEVNLGLIPGFGGTQRLVDRIGMPRALDMILCGKGRRMNAAEALGAGLVSRVVAKDKLDAEIESMIKAIEEASPYAVGEAKKLCREARHMSLEAGLQAEAWAFASCFSHPDHSEGIEAFLEKRKAAF